MCLRRENSWKFKLNMAEKEGNCITYGIWLLEELKLRAYMEGFTLDRRLEWSELTMKRVQLWLYSFSSFKSNFSLLSCSLQWKQWSKKKKQWHWFDLESVVFCDPHETELHISNSINAVVSLDINISMRLRLALLPGCMLQYEKSQPFSKY